MLCDTEWTMSIPGPRPTRRVAGREWSKICIGVPRHSLCSSTLAAKSRCCRFLVSVREELESYESFVIQERWPDSEGPPMWTNENRARYDRSHLRYPSDLTDDEWSLVEPLIPPGRRGGDKRTVIMREGVNGLMYILSTGCQLRVIPHNTPPPPPLLQFFC